MQIPFFRDLPRKEFNKFHLCLTKKSFQRGQLVCKEGQPSDYIFIISKGEFEVSKVIDQTKIKTKLDEPSKKLDS